MDCAWVVVGAAQVPTHVPSTGTSVVLPRLVATSEKVRS